MAAPTPVHIETLDDPFKYAEAQIRFACLVHTILNRGKLVLVEPPWTR